LIGKRRDILNRAGPLEYGLTLKMKRNTLLDDEGAKGNVCLCDDHRVFAVSPEHASYSDRCWIEEAYRKNAHFLIIVDQKRMWIWPGNRDCGGWIDAKSVTLDRRDNLVVGIPDISGNGDSGFDTVDLEQILPVEFE